MTNITLNRVGFGRIGVDASASHIQDITQEFEKNVITDSAQWDPKATHWLIDQFLPEGDSILAGASFVGKTFVLTNLVAVMLGLITQENLVASRRRKIVWLTEDRDQILQALSVLDYDDGLSVDDFHKNCLLLPAQRIDAQDLGLVVKAMVEKRGWDKEHNPPLIIVDTMAASLDCEDINNAAKASKLLASLRQAWREYSILITMHTAKQGDNKEAMGSVAFKADMQNAFYVNNYTGGHDMREVGFTKRRANGTIKRIITQLDTVVPMELLDRDDQLVTEWIPKIRLVGQTAEEREAFDAEHDTTGMPDVNRQRQEAATQAADALLDAMADREWPSMSKTALAKAMLESYPELAGSEKTAKRRVDKAIEEGRLKQTDEGWFVLSTSEVL